MLQPRVDQPEEDGDDEEEEDSLFLCQSRENRGSYGRRDEGFHHDLRCGGCCCADGAERGLAAIGRLVQRPCGTKFLGGRAKKGTSEVALGDGGEGGRAGA